MGTTKLIGVMGSGLIGTEPFEENAWSGSSRFFFNECHRVGILHRAYGVEVEPARRVPRMLANFSLDRDLWRKKFYLDTRYYDDLSRRIVDALGPEDDPHALLQIGGIYNLRPLLGPARRIFSYHDGNLAQAMRSPQFSRNLSPRRLELALDYERRVYHNIDVIFTMSDYLRRSFVDDFGVDPDRVKTIGAGINLEAVPEVPTAKDYASKKLVFVGADFDRKGGQCLLQAFQKVRTVYPSAVLRIVGPRHVRIPSELSAGIDHVGFLSKRDPAGLFRLEQIFAESSLFVLPSLYEPFGIAPLEAMAYELPAVLTDAWAFPEMVTPGVNGELVRPGDVDDLADKVISLLKDPDKLQSMGRAGRNLVMAKFTWQSVVDRLREHLPES